MIDHSVDQDILLKRSELRVRSSFNLRDDSTMCLEKSMKAIMRSRELLASSEALLNHPQFTGLVAPIRAVDNPEPSSVELQFVSKSDFDSEIVPIDGKHFRECHFANCTLLYRGLPVTFESCQFHGCKFEFSGAAGRTVQFLDCFGQLTDQSADQPSASPDSIPNFIN